MSRVYKRSMNPYPVYSHTPKYVTVLIKDLEESAASIFRAGMCRWVPSFGRMHRTPVCHECVGSWFLVRLHRHGTRFSALKLEQTGLRIWYLSLFYPDDGGSWFLQKIGKYPLYYMASHPPPNILFILIAVRTSDPV